MLLGYQVAIFIIGWMAYASTYLLRKPLGVIKSSLQTDLSLNTSALGWLDVSLLLPYAAAQIMFGSIGDRFGARHTLAVSLILSGASMVAFGLQNRIGVLYLLLFLNGFTQSQCWPNCTKILATWFEAKSKNTVFGLYGTCAFAGGIVGTTLAVYLLSTTGSWRQVHYIPSYIVMGLGLVVLLFYRQSDEAGFNVQSDPNAILPSHNPAENEEACRPSVKQLLTLPAVREISAAVFFLKLVRYCMYMWLPLFLEKQLLYSATEAGMFSTVFEIGGVLGSAALGYLLDRFSTASPLRGVAYCIFLSSLSFVLFYTTSTGGRIPNSVCLFLAGAFNCGPDTILGAAMPNKIGTSQGRNCAAAVTGIVNGIGSVGPILEGPLIALVSYYFGWSSMFLLMIGCSVMGAGATLIAARRLAV